MGIGMGGKRREYLLAVCPSYYCRQERRKASKVADSNFTNNEEIPAEDAESDITCDVIHTGKVVYPQQELELEPNKSKDNPYLEAVELPCNTNERMDEYIDNNPTEKAEELPCEKPRATVNRVLTTEEVESAIEAKLLEFTNVNTTNDKFQCEMSKFKCKWNKSLRMHMLKKHSKIEISEDSNEVNTATKDTTTPTPHPPINPTNTPTPLTINPTKNPTTFEETAPICHHFQRGACNYGECCWKKTCTP